MARVFARGGRAASRLATVALRPKAGAPGDAYLFDRGYVTADSDAARDGDICSPAAVPASSPASSPPKRLFSEPEEEGKEGLEFGQYLYEIYNHDLELRVSKAGVKLLLTRWMKDLEKIFYGNIIAYDDAMTPDANVDDLANVIWRNVFSEDGSKIPNDALANAAVQAMARYTCRESTCLLLTEKEALFSGNFMFTSLENKFNSKKMAN
ncbi:ubiquinol-cytochrome-c reductase complex assembly factor 1 [Canna indica]|uniref:Ubiquinol-cytochrome-c reductase complex assembly factor 1 n=1 Tax=Canna indica TaxID=4628 RepID=A0AAQ3JSI3_9LILI|nr:ubiquinol-cytochrome-c reductase complex assembly factor 1 [Canna indica]